MTTKTEKIAALKLEYPTLRTGSDEYGYTDLSPTDYEALIESWADNQLADEAKLAEAEAVETAKLDAITKLIALGIDPKAFGLVIEEKSEKA
jgi:hypothetical protein